jgi:hypothetical protein
MSWLQDAQPGTAQKRPSTNNQVDLGILITSFPKPMPLTVGIATKHRRSTRIDRVGDHEAGWVHRPRYRRFIKTGRDSEIPNSGRFVNRHRARSFAGFRFFSGRQFLVRLSRIGYSQNDEAQAMKNEGEG